MQTAFKAPAAIAAAALALHAATLGRYGFYRDELYFLACAKRLGWGFVDQPPLVPLIASLALPFHEKLFAVRIACAIAAAGTVLVADRLACDFGAGAFARVICAFAVALMPAGLFLGNTLTTTSFEPLTWTMAILFALRYSRAGGFPTWIAFAAVCATAAYMKYSIFMLLGALVLAAVATRDRRLALGVLAAGASALIVLSPNLAWQAKHGFPFAAVAAGDVAGRHAFNMGPQYEYAGLLANAPAFILEQVAFANPFAAPLWVAGLLRRRILSWTYAVLFFGGILLSAKGYYLAGVYPALFAAGSVEVEAWARSLRRLTLAAIVVSGIALAPMTLPLLPFRGIVAMQPLFADEFGWRAMTAAVASAYRALPRQERVQTPIFADTYGDAAALEHYGPRAGLPPPIGAQNQYFLWGTHGYRLRTMLAVGASEYRNLKVLYAHVVLVGLFTDPRRSAEEGPTPIYFCSGPRLPDGDIWRRLRWYGA